MAKKFNLQPWRERLRAELKNKFNITTAAIAFATAALLFADRWMQMRYVEQQEAGINLLNTEIESLKSTQKQIELIKVLNKEVLQQINTINHLQNKRGLAVEMLDFITKNTPNNVFLKGIKYTEKNNTILINGVAEDGTAISNFINKLNTFERFEQFELDKAGIVFARSNKIYKVPDESITSNIKEFNLLISISQENSKLK